MIKKLFETTAMGILGARIIPAAYTGVMYSAAAVLSAGILFIVFVGMSPLLLPSSTAAEEEKPDALSRRPRLVKATPLRGDDPRAEGFADVKPACRTTNESADPSTGEPTSL